MLFIESYNEHPTLEKSEKRAHFISYILHFVQFPSHQISPKIRKNSQSNYDHFVPRTKEISIQVPSIHRCARIHKNTKSQKHPASNNNSQCSGAGRATYVRITDVGVDEIQRNLRYTHGEAESLSTAFAVIHRPCLTSTGSSKRIRGCTANLRGSSS